MVRQLTCPRARARNRPIYFTFTHLVTYTSFAFFFRPISAYWCLLVWAAVIGMCLGFVSATGPHRTDPVAHIVPIFITFFTNAAFFGYKAFRYERRPELQTGALRCSCAA